MFDMITHYCPWLSLYYHLWYMIERYELACVTQVICITQVICHDWGSPGADFHRSHHCALRRRWFLFSRVFGLYAGRLGDISRLAQLLGVEHSNDLIKLMGVCWKLDILWYLYVYYNTTPSGMGQGRYPRCFVKGQTKLALPRRSFKAFESFCFARSPHKSEFMFRLPWTSIVKNVLVSISKFNMPIFMNIL